MTPTPPPVPTARGHAVTADPPRKGCRRALVALAVAVVMFTGTPAPAAAQSVGETDAASSVRIAARKLADGRVEFGLQLADGEQWLPRARLFPYPTVDAGRWLQASPYRMSDGNDVRVTARKLASGKVEFALQVGEDRQWLPQARLFPYSTATVRRWLYSSWYTVGDRTAPLADSGTAPTASTTPERGQWTLDRTEAGAPIISTLATAHEYIWPSVVPDVPPLLAIACGSRGAWHNLTSWRSIWPLRRLSRHREASARLLAAGTRRLDQSRPGNP